MEKIQSKMKALEFQQDFPHYNVEDPIKNKGARVLTSLYVVFFRRSRAGNSTVSCDFPPKFELIQAFMVVLIGCKNTEDPIKNEGARVLTAFLPLYVY